MRNLNAAAVMGLVLATSFTSPRAEAFCGFYVGKADSNLYNHASKVVLARNENKNVISMMNDYQGDLKEFAIVVPVPTVLEKGQVHVGEKVLFDRLDAYSAPRLVEYFDEDPCRVYMMNDGAPQAAAVGSMAKGRGAREKALGVTIESQFTVGEYDILILSAKESGGLETWLKENGYKIPKGASKALGPYIKQKLKFFVAKVNLAEQAKTGLTYLRPLQFAYEYEKFMLPIRLGMVNAQGPQDLLVFALSKEGRVETTNYRTIKIPTGLDIPEYVRGDFAEFYKAMFATAAKKEDYRAVFTEHFWDMSWCDPCAADPLSQDELRKLGVFWIPAPGESIPVTVPGKFQPRSRILPMPGPGGGSPVPVMVTRLHIRYTPETFPEDLMFQETKDRENFQGRYVLRHPWKGDAGSCEMAKNYFKALPERRESEAKNLANLTGWDINEIRKKMGGMPESTDSKKSKPKWWENIWN